MKCSECGYYWKEENEAFASCHFVGLVGWAPCEQGEIEDYYFEDEIEESEDE